MSTTTTTRRRARATTTPGGRSRRAAAEARQRRQRRILVQVGLVLAAAVVVLFLIARSSSDSGSGGDGGGAGAAGGPDFVVGTPGPGEAAPPIRLESSSGEVWDLGRDGAGQTTLLYFQEGLMCQPCWDQMGDIEANFADYQALGIDEMVAITVNPVDLLRQKLADEGLDSIALSDPDVSLGPTYSANQYGMMGTAMYGHTFIVVGPDGRILWRGDYGGPPRHTMYVANSDLLADLRAGLDGTADGSR